MSPEWEHLITVWGYWLMAFGALIEGETFLIIGGIAAANALLHLPGLILLSVVGCLIHDSFFFYIGRFAGLKILKRKPNWQPRIYSITKLLERHDFWLIIGFRFAYGLRTIIPFALGVSKITNSKFLFFDLIGAILWSFIFILGGYYFGQGLLLLMKQLDLSDFVRTHWLLSLAALIIFVSLVMFTIMYVQKKRRKSKNMIQQLSQPKETKTEMKVDD